MYGRAEFDLLKLRVLYQSTKSGQKEQEASSTTGEFPEETEDDEKCTYEVDDIYATCERLMKAGVTIHRPPRDGMMAFVRSPDKQSIELLQKGAALPAKEPWKSMPNTGHW